MVDTQLARLGCSTFGTGTDSAWFNIIWLPEVIVYSLRRWRLFLASSLLHFVLLVR